MLHPNNQRRSVRFRASILATLVGGLVLCGPASLRGETIPSLVTLTDLNSSVHFGLGRLGSGMDEWIVDGTSQLREQSFWYRIGQTPEQSINVLTLSAASTTRPNELLATYSGAGFTVELDYTLHGAPAGSYQSDVAEVVRITNTASQSLDFHFFQYVDLNLLGSPQDSLVHLSGGLAGINTADQADGPLGISETVIVPRPSRWQADYYDAIRQRLTNDGPDDLDITKTTAANGDLAWAFQWDRQLAPGDVLLISKDKYLSVVPEPPAVALLICSALGLLGYARRRRK